MIETSYGLYISVQNEAKESLRKIVEETINANAKHKAEVCVNICGISKEFTLDDFLMRLGFNPDEI